MPRSARPFRAGVLSAVLVLVPAAGALAAARAGLHAGARALAEADPGGALLGLAAVALSGVLAWAAAAAAAGVVEAWSRTSPAHPRTTGVGDRAGAGGGAGAGAGAGAGTAVAGGRGRGGMVSAGVAALVVAALTAPGAAASTGPAARPAVVAQDATAAPSPSTLPTSTSASTTSTATAGTATAPRTATPSTLPSGAGGGDGAVTSTPAAQDSDTDVPDLVPVAATEALPGSWSALAPTGFRAPRGSGVDSAALVTAPALRPSGAAVGPSTAAPEVVVLAGDSLWSLAARHLGPGADASEVAEAWPRWWEANRAIVGDDPDLLLPGQRLVAPLP